MNRRALLESAVLGLWGLGCSRAGTSVSRVPTTASPAGGPVSLKNWVWIGLEGEPSPDEWKRQFARMHSAGISAILPEVYNGRHAYFASQRLPVKTERLEMMLPLAKAEGLEV